MAKIVITVRTEVVRKWDTGTISINAYDIDEEDDVRINDEVNREGGWRVISSSDETHEIEI